MTAAYNPQKIEKKWQKYWDKEKIYKTQDSNDKPKYYILDMFPYPSGDGLHMGHVESYTASDIIYRFKKLQGYDVLHPQGFDSFGLPAENYAIKTGAHPKETTKANADNYIQQMKMLGLGHDLEHLVYTSKPSYYKWTQFLFGKFFENNLVEQKTDMINWCPSCNTGIANEQVESGKCERCKTEIEQKEVPGWFFKITDFADELINGLDKVDWPEHTIKNQRNWIGKSEGALLKFKIVGGEMDIDVFTTRPDTLFGATYMVVAPEHELISSLKSQILNYKEVGEYIKKARNKTEMERVENKEKTGVELKGVKAINPANNEEIPVFIADYVLSGYGTGAIMAVPAHDERDMEFAKKFNISIKQVITPSLDDYQKTNKVLKALNTITTEANRVGVDFWLLGGLACAFYAKTIYRAHDDLDLIAKNEKDYGKLVEVFEKIGFEKIKEKKISDSLTNTIFENENKIEIDIGLYAGAFGLSDNDFEEEEKNIGDIKCKTLSRRFLTNVKKSQMKKRNLPKDKIDMDYLKGKTFADNGYLVNSSEFDGLSSEEAKKKITKFVDGELTSTYRLRDWSISRQRYWGCPIPIVYSPKGDAKFVGENNLPWLLPEDVDFVPDGTAPLAKSEELKKRTERIFGKGWTPEVDTMDTFVDSSWYFLRYPDTKNEEEFCSIEKLKKWFPVDLYIGGAEHTYMHLLYARFFVKAMKKIGLVDFGEPFAKLRHQGMVLDKNGAKMSKSKGNVVNPNDIVKAFSADATRMYMMFAGPLEDELVFKEEGVKGVARFLEKVWRIFQEKELVMCGQGKCGDVPKEIPPLFHKTIKKVTEDIETFSFNTAISQMMIFINEASKHDKFPKAAMERFLILLSPFAPHIAEEIYQNVLGNSKSIFLQEWPKFNPDMIVDETIEMVVQVNGKVRDKIEVAADISEDEAKEKSQESERIKKYIEGKDIRKIIFVPGKLINIVI